MKSHLHISPALVCLFYGKRWSGYNFFYSFKNTWIRLTEEKKVRNKYCLAVFQTRDFGEFYPVFTTGSPELESRDENPPEDPIGLVS